MSQSNEADLVDRHPAAKGKLVGASPRRKDSPDALTGRATYTADIDLPGMLYAAIYRSPHAHARILNVDLSRVLNLPGVVMALSGADLPDFIKPMATLHKFGKDETLREGNPSLKQPHYFCLAVDKVRYVGEPVAIVVASNPYVAEDALELINADFESLPAVVDAEKALEKDAALLYEDWGENAMVKFSVSGGDVEKAFQEASCVISETIKSSRFTGTPIEPRVVVARYDRTTHLMEVWDTTQSAHIVVGWIHRAISLPGLRVRVVVTRLGGAFGQKGTHYPEEILIPMAAYLTNKPVKWVETRSEHMVATIHSREQVHHLDVAVAKDGTILGLKDRIIVNMGAGWSSSGPPSVIISTMFVPGVYRIRNYEAQLLGVVTNKTAFGAHRGFGKAEAAYVIERLIEIVARKLGLDPIEIRRRNFIRAEEFPYRSVTGSQYDSGNYDQTLDKALNLADYYGWRKIQKKARQEGRLIGIGTAVVIEPTSTHRRGAAISYGVRIRLDPSGQVWVFLSGNDDGTGHGTVISQIVADELGVPFSDVNVVEGDSLLCPHGTGSHSSRFAIMGTSAVMLGARELRKKVLAVASALLETSPEKLEIEDGTVRLKDDPSRQLPIQEAARVSYFAVHRLPDTVEPGMEILYYYRDPNVSPKFDERGRLAAYSSFPYAVDIAVVEVDPETGKLQILQYVSVHDCGNMINPKEVAGQHLGALAHGIGGALYEELVYDETGQPLAQNFKDYLVPTAVEVPRFKLDHTTTPAPFTPGGFKGAGETGTVSPPPCLANAVEDALSPLGVEIRTLPLKPDFIWELLRSARRKR